MSKPIGFRIKLKESNDLLTMTYSSTMRKDPLSRFTTPTILKQQRTVGLLVPTMILVSFA